LLAKEMRYKMLLDRNPEEAKRLLERAREDVLRRWQLYEHWAAMPAKDISKKKE
jgi:hypothetical protein